MKKRIILNFGMFSCLLFLFISTPDYSISAIKVSAEVDTSPSRINMTYYSSRSNSRGFSWCTSSSVTGGRLQLIKYDKSVAVEDIDWTKSSTYYAGTRNFYSNVKSWQARVEGLEYGAQYYYRVGSPNYSYSTPKLITITDGSKPLSFIHFTDPQGYSTSDYSVLTDTLDRARDIMGDVDGLFCTGDISQSYYDPDANINEWGYSLNSMYSYLQDTVITPACGNHDKVDGMFFNHFLTDFDYCSSWTDGFYYSYNLGDIHVTVINTNEELTGTTDLSTKQINWLKNDLSISTAHWKILLTHKGFYTGGRHCNEDDIVRLRDSLLPIISENHVDLVLQGHDHVYTRTNPYLWDNNGRLSNDNYDSVSLLSPHNNQVNYSINPGTYYVIPNTSTGNSINLSPLASSIPSYFDIATSPYNGETLNTQPNLPMFGCINIDDSTLTYESYVNNKDGTSTLYDSFGIVKYCKSHVEEEIKALPDTYSDEYKVDISSSLEHYNLLEEVEQKKVDSSLKSKLLTLGENVSLEAYKEASDVRNQINTLPSTLLTAGYLTKLNQIKSSYEALSSLAKTYVNNFDEYLTKYNAYKVEEKVEVVKEKIETLKSLTILSSDYPALVEARSSYNELANNERLLVINYFTLAKIETAFGVYYPQLTEEY